MKILMISDVYFPRVNGVSTSIRTFRNSLEKLGHETWLIAPDYGVVNEPEKNIIRVDSRYVFVDPEDRMLKSGKIMALIEQLKQKHFDLLHIQTPFIAHRVGIKLARELVIPTVETYHTYFEEYLFHYIPFLPKRLMRAAARWFSRNQCNQVDAVVVPSHAMSEVLLNYGIQTSISVIPTGLNFSEFSDGSKDRFCERFGIDRTRTILVHIGRVAHEKNIDFLLEVVSEVRQHQADILLVIAGEGPARKGLGKKVQQLMIQNHVLFVDYLPRGPALWDCFCVGDVFVFASSTETQGLVLLEAMALGVPVVSTAVMGTKDILSAGKGALVAEQTIDNFSLKIMEIVENQALHKQLSDEARQYARQWSTEQMAVTMVAFYKSVIEGYKKEFAISS